MSASRLRKLLASKKRRARARYKQRRAEQKLADKAASRLLGVSIRQTMPGDDPDRLIKMVAAGRLWLGL